MSLEIHGLFDESRNVFRMGSDVLPPLSARKSLVGTGIWDTISHIWGYLFGEKFVRLKVKIFDEKKHEYISKKLYFLTDEAKLLLGIGLADRNQKSNSMGIGRALAHILHSFSNTPSYRVKKEQVLPPPITQGPSFSYIHEILFHSVLQSSDTISSENMRTMGFQIPAHPCSHALKDRVFWEQLLETNKDQKVSLPRGLSNKDAQFLTVFRLLRNQVLLFEKNGQGTLQQVLDQHFQDVQVPKPSPPAQTVNLQPLLACLNSVSTTVEQLEALITKGTADARLFVQEPTENELLSAARQPVGTARLKRYAEANPSQINAPAAAQEEIDSYVPIANDQGNFTREILDALRSKNHTTTLANIIARNELHLSPGDVSRLMKKLMEVKADFSAVDYTDIIGDHYLLPHIQNNPLKSLIALGGTNRDYDALISELIAHIQQREDLTEEQKRSCLSKRDTYLYGPMTHVHFLIRQGKEDLAVQAIRAGASVSEAELLLACASFGTTSRERPGGVTCVDLILERLPSLSRETKETCLKNLRRASLHQYKEIETRRLTTRDPLSQFSSRVIGTWCHFLGWSGTQLESTYATFLKKSGEFFDSVPKKTVNQETIHAFKETLTPDERMLLDAQVKTTIQTEQLHAEFSDYFRFGYEDEGQSLATLPLVKLEYASTEEGQRHLDSLIDQISQKQIAV